MIPTIFGGILLVVGVGLLLRGSVVAMFVLVVVSSLFGGSAALLLPALGGASVPPVNLALLFLVARVVLPGSGQGDLVRAALRDNLPLVVFVLYGVVLALIGPRLFRRPDAGRADASGQRTVVRQSSARADGAEPDDGVLHDRDAAVRRRQLRRLPRSTRVCARWSMPGYGRRGRT